MLFSKLVIAVTLYTVSVLSFWSFNIYTFIGVSLLTFSNVESSSAG